MPSMGVWETEDEMDGPIMAAAAALPTPTDTPYRTPSRTSRRSRRSVTPPRKGISPPPMPNTDKTDKTDRSSKRSSKDLATDETISIFDPRRFTPTLHANLVSEILNLRRDQEEKMKIIESLETALHTTKEEQESLQETALGTAKENRSLKRQLALLEGGTSSALGELAREREEAVETAGETKKRLEQTQKRLRHHEEDLQRTHDEWAKEKEAWEEEKRKYERKLHVADTRLKTVLEEVAAYHAAQVNGMNGNGMEGDELEDATTAGKDNDAASVRTMSMTNSIRFSVVPSKPNGNSLADELNFDGDETDETDHGGRESVLSYRLHGRSHSRDSTISRSHRRQQSNESLRRPGSVARGRFLNQSVLERLEGVTIEEDDEEQAPASPAVKASKAPKVEYTDSSCQYSPPPSPKMAPQAPTPEPVPVIELQQPQAPPPPIPSRADRSSLHDSMDSTSRGEWGEIEANQRRKRVHIARPLTIEPVVMPSSLMVSVGSQTMADEPLSPPKTPKSPPFEKDLKRASLATPVKPVAPPMVSSETQTDPPTPPASPIPEQQPGLIPLSQMLIPSISIHPPTSRPTTPREPRLPPLVKDFGCQVEISRPMQSKSVSVQTDEIRVDKRLDRLPPHLHPSAITSRPSSPVVMITDPVAAAVDDLSKQHFVPAPGALPPRNPRRLVSRSGTPSEPPSSPPAPVAAPVPASSAFGNEETHDAYPGNNDDGPLSSQKAPMRRPHRISSLFAGFDGGSSDEVDEFADADMSDSEYRTALSAPKPKAGSSSRSGNKRNSGALSGTASPDSLPRRSSVRNSVRLMGSIAATETYSKYAMADVRDSREIVTGRKTSVRSSRMSFEKSGGSVLGPSGNKSAVMRKAAMIQNGIATHQGLRSRSPSLPDPRDPPFPIPTRASSRKPPTSISAPSDGQRSPTRADGWHHRRGGSRNHYRANSIRKVRSAAAIPVKPRTRRHGSRSPPLQQSPFSADEEPESPGLPPLPTNDITAPRFGSSTGSRYRPQHSHQASINTAITDQTNAASVNSSNQATGVVDAIAQTMVGEWMYKYVRRRKSFGAAETAGRDDSSNDRHKRWVWLAPYERAILWSSKQPSSNSTLMGKSGRKLTIQSVLDVKDDNPPPKGCNQLFNRSILILTPQRALKFTATTPERHYLWLTSLSFLAHSQQAIPENITAPPPLPKAIPDFDLSSRSSKLRKGGIRDSIRLTKNKTAVLGTMSGSSVTVPPPLPPMSMASSHADSVPPSIPSYRPAESYTSAPSVTYQSAPSVAATSSTHQRDTSRDTAEPPVIARFHDRSSQAMVHGRKRSNTGGHVPPPLSFRGFSGPAGSSSSYYHASSNSTAANSDISQSQASSWGISVSGGANSQRTSEASSRPSGAVMNNFFDAIGTVRMEAFISPLALSQFDEYPDEQEEMRYRARRRSKEMRRRASRSRHRENRDSYNSRTTRTTDDYYAASRAGTEEDYFRDDPFKGF